ncbi:hypothetical protein [Mycolicibacterium porcinum]|uniref:hypothetical protein n=1 Tax=Mycolicibacterium porcinum TaxID=39693 RepID=UPI0010427C93|nr:hypothetical protein [Mycolicibacterium porcinum]
MSRNMIAANTAVFRRLVEHCARRGVSLDGPGKPRWVHANADADILLQQLVVQDSISFGRHRHLAWLEHRGQHFVSLVGFGDEMGYQDLSLREDVQGFDVCLISEIEIHPNALPFQIKDVVEAGSKDDPGYIGHDGDQVMSLFPTIQILESHNSLTKELIWSIFLRLCVDESRLGGSWIDDRLAESLGALAQLNVSSLPYQELCRAVLDLDPRSLYMSLYRCIEATYAFEHASRLASALSVDFAWNEVAAILDRDMGWRPPELQSLNVALAHAHDADLRDVCSCLGVEVGNDIQASAGRAIYRLRNQIVHYRPTLNPLTFESVDWNRICNALVTIALDVFYRAYVA